MVLRRNHPTGSRILRRYVVSEYLLSFGIAFLFFIAIFFVNQILVIARDRLADQVSVLDTLKLIIFAMPAIIALSVPYASFIGVILALGKLSEGREILAARAGGVSFRSLITPVAAAAAVLSFFSFFVNDYFLPVGTMEYGRLYQEILYSNSKLIIEPYSVRQYDSSTLVTGEVSDDKIDGLMILDQDDEGNQRTINAASARLVRNDNSAGIITLHLEGVELYSRSRDSFHTSKAASMDYNILLEEIDFNSGGPTIREMSARDVLTLRADRWQELEARLQRSLDTTETSLIQYLLAVENYAENPSTSNADNLEIQYAGYTDSLEAIPNIQGDRTLRLYSIEFWKKITIPLAGLTFIFIGFPLGLSARNQGRTFGIITGLILASAYWGALVAINQIGMKLTSIPVWIISFLPNVAMLIGGFFMLRAYLRR